MNDSRKDDRLNVALIMRYREPTMLEPREGQCQNVSLSGMCIVTPKPSPRGALIRFECISGGAADGIRGTARVVWQRSKGDQRGAASMGVRFVRLEPGCREALEALVDQLGGERKPSGSGMPRAAGGSDAPAGTPSSDRPGKDTLIVSPASASGMTQQGMGAARTRSAHYPTLRGIGLPSSVPPRGEKRKSSRAPALNVTLPGHATTSSPPFSTTPSVPPEVPADDTSRQTGSLRDRVDRTHRGVGPSSSPPDSEQDAFDASTSAAAHAAAADVADDSIGAGSGTSASDRAPREADSDRSPPPGGADDHYDAPPSSDSPHRRSDRGDVEDADVMSTAEAVDDAFAARRRAARAAAFSSAPLELPDPDTVRRRNWLPWVVIGTGLLVSWLMIRAFGSVPAGVPVSASAEDVDESSASAPAEPAQTAPSPAQTAATAPIAQATPGTLRTGGYALDVSSEPSGARISAADQVVLAPAVIELAMVSGPIEVKAELEGYEPTTTTIDPTEFKPQDGRHVAKAVLKLTPASKRASEDKEQASSQRERSAKPSAPRRPRTRSTDEEAPSAAPSTPQIAMPPVPIQSQPPAPPGAATAEAPAASAPPAPAAPEPPAQSSSGPSALETALQCLSRGDNLCVITTLEGKARSARELEVLIETHLALGNSADAERSMRRYIDRFPDGKSAAKYQRWLERRGAGEP